MFQRPHSKTWCFQKPVSSEPKSRRTTRRPVSSEPKSRRTTHPMICDKTFVTAMRKNAQNNGTKRKHLNNGHCHRPDLNPIEKFWGWLRRELRRRDLKDLQEKRPPLSKTAFRARVRTVLRSQKAHRAASKFARGLLNVCKEAKAYLPEEEEG